MSTTDDRLLGWLMNRRKGRGDTAAALGFAVQAFRVRPAIESYQEVRALANSVERWEELRPALIAFLIEHEHTWLLVKVHLADGQIDQALQSLQLFRSGHPYYPGFKLAQDVAAAAEAGRPQAAIEIYQQQAEGLIGLRSRAHYRDACRLLGRLRSLYQGLGEDGLWGTYIRGLSERHHNLRALKEELAAARLS